MQSRNRIQELAPTNIVVLRALQLGDLLCTVPALRALRHALPDANITLVGLPWSAGFVNRFQHYLNDFIEFPGYPGLPEVAPRLEDIPLFILEMQRRKFDLSIQMQGNGSIVNPLMVLWGAKVTSGYYLPGEYCPDRNWFIPYPDDHNEVLRHLHLMEFLGAPTRGTELEFPVMEEELQELRELQILNDIQPGDYVILHPGSRLPERRWPASVFAEIGSHFIEQGIKIVITGTNPEKKIAQEVNQLMGSHAVDLVGQTNLGVAAGLVKQARFVITNDTGMSHIAAAVKVPSVVLISTSDPDRWAPLDRNLHRVVHWTDASSPQAVIREINTILQENRSYSAG